MCCWGVIPPDPYFTPSHILQAPLGLLHFRSYDQMLGTFVLWPSSLVSEREFVEPTPAPSHHQSAFTLGTLSHTPPFRTALHAGSAEPDSGAAGLSTVATAAAQRQPQTQRQACVWQCSEVPATCTCPAAGTAQCMLWLQQHAASPQCWSAMLADLAAEAVAVAAAAKAAGAQEPLALAPRHTPSASRFGCGAVASAGGSTLPSATPSPPTAQSSLLPTPSAPSFVDGLKSMMHEVIGGANARMHRPARQRPEQLAPGGADTAALQSLTEPTSRTPVALSDVPIDWGASVPFESAQACVRAAGGIGGAPSSSNGRAGLVDGVRGRNSKAPGSCNWLRWHGLAQGSSLSGTVLTNFQSTNIANGERRGHALLGAIQVRGCRSMGKAGLGRSR
jgi:hypothetical protein